mgnify:CR=1 FL=1
MLDNGTAGDAVAGDGIYSVLLPGVFQNFTGVFNTSGTAQAGLNIPNVGGLVGIKAYTAYVTFPGGVNGFHTVSNPFSFTLEK